MKNEFPLYLNCIPSEWSIIPCRVFFKITSINNTKGETHLSVYRDYGVIPTDSRDDNHNKISEDTSKYKLVEPGDFVLNKMKCWSGSLGVSDYRGIVSPSYIILKPVRKIHNKYFHYLLRSETYRQMYESLSYGVRIGQWELRHHDFKQIPCIYPPFEEQEMIAQYLDKQIKHIAKIIEKKEKLILLLKEQQNSYMTHYVTKGLNPNAVKKKTGINWIGKIPRDWTTVPLKRVFSDFFGGSWGKEPIPGQKEHLVNVIRVTEFNMETHMVKNDLPTIRSLTLQDGSKKLVQKNDIILEKSGGGEKTPVGRVVLCDLDPDYPTVNSNFTNLCRPNIEVIDPKYCVYLLTSLHRSGAVMQNINQTTGIQNLDIDAYMSDHVVLPPLDDQKKIVNKINKYSNKIMNLINKYKEQINLLKEYQKSLISFSVTGKVRVMRDML